MKRKYSAEEIRDAILKLKAFQEDKKMLLRIEDMLHQAADMLECKKKSKRRYEYAVKYINGRRVWKSSHHYESIKLCKKDHWPLEGRKFIRRDVGEWEDVKDA